MAAQMWEQIECIMAKDLTADGTSEVLTSVVDMADADEVMFAVAHGDVDALAVMTYTLKENSANSTSSPTPTAVTLVNASGTGASISSGALTITEASGNLDDKLILVGATKEKLSKRYVFLSITCSVESHEVDKILCFKRRKDSEPVTQGSTVAAVGYTA